MAQWFAGERVTASKLSTTRLEAVCTLALTVTAVATDITGMSSTFTTTRDNVVVQAVTHLDALALGADPITGTLVGELVVNGVAESAQVLWNAGSEVTHDAARNMPSQTWVVTLASAGSHTLKVRASRVAGTAGDLQIQTTHSTMVLIVEDHV